MARNKDTRYSSPVANVGSSPKSLPATSDEEHDTKANKHTTLQEIKASDDEDSDQNSSDDSLEDLSTILGRVRPTDGTMPTHARAPQDLLSTPKAKRTASATLKSPLAIMPKHRFDLKALAKDARQENATQASSLKIQAHSRDPKVFARELTPASTIATIFAENDPEKAQKVIRAVQRAGPTSSQLRFHFFAEEIPPRSSKLYKMVNGGGPWALLTKGDTHTREQYIMSGMPQALIFKMGGLPVPVLESLIQDICVQKSSIVRHEYCNMIESCSGQISTSMTIDMLQKMFKSLGAEPVNLDMTGGQLQLAASKPDEDVYKGREWSNLKSVLELLTRVAPNLSTDALCYVIKLLLCMSMDSLIVYSLDLMGAFECAMERLVEAVPELSWDSLCFDACLYIQKHIAYQNIRLTALVCIPTRSAAGHELRRRLAIGFLFEDAARSKDSPESSVNLAQAADLLEGLEFNIGPDTDFVEFRARVFLLDMAIDDGNVELTFANEEAEQQFNNNVDRITARLRDMWRRINDTGMKLSRTEAKSVVEWVQKRLALSVRTQKELRRNIFDVPDKQSNIDVSRQKKFMETFFKRPKEPATEKG